MIAFDGVVVRYPRAVRAAVDGVSFDVPRGAITAIAGPNGSGKSTLVRALLGRVPMAAGSITVDGEDASRLDRRELARRVAVVSQREEPAFPLAVRDYIALGRHPHAHVWSAVDPAGRTAIDRARPRWNRSSTARPMSCRAVSGSAFG
jgi:iron complex transport system ATP-binding protein